MKKDYMESIGQLMVFGFGGKQITPELKKMIHENKLGCIILFSRNLAEPSQIHQLTNELQSEAKKAGHQYPLMICTDQENGAVRRLGKGSTAFPGSMVLGATHNVNNAYEVAKMTSEELKNVGINWNLAPVIDVNNNPLNPVICTRSFGEDPQNVAEMGKAFMRGLQENGIISTLKHFPGHGDTGVDSHLDLPIIKHSMGRLEKVELVPFHCCIDAGADVIMSAHIYFPALEKQYALPATLSKNILTGLLRERLHFQGVITTDCLEMKAIADHFGTARGAVMALKAGADMVMVSHTYEKQIETLNQVAKAVETRQIDGDSIIKSIERVHRLKKKYLNWQDALNPESISVGSKKSHQSEAARIYKEGITVIKNEHQALPVSNTDRVLFIYSERFMSAKVEDQSSHLSFVEKIVKDIHSEADVFNREDPELIDLINNYHYKMKKYQVVVVLIESVSMEKSQVTLFNELKKADCPLIVIAGKSPYGIRSFSEADALLCTYDINPTALTIVIRAIFGLEEVRGTLPVSL
ncbi:beta-N-acetylhexosaminidase [Sporolactobacillus shoreicorticis]|uniref:Beta-N-acetylhexosaminidase n=1 Tax=Sporolactobacillus shoreicorticis TaxID=1923877 RepID=A0ABW5S5F6_9BACL|nr:beta-N-acetylhexosaminidase [Sporolactobacillus shoreicorticis]MCO7128047.1 beta-N-acetylhexosaminidase [Sporolactobacillus shoreicorticis]